MPRFTAAALVLWSAATPVVRAQGPAAERWNDERTIALVERAAALRRRQLADTGLTNYAATARGYLTFLAQVGEGFTEPPKIVRADELALEVYWRAPNYSKQWIVGRRDTLLLPTDINYHRDHLGIVQNNFPNIIRLGEGDEVRDVPHPMSVGGTSVYDYRISDSLRFQLPGRSIDVYEIKVRPKDDRVAAVVGAVYVSTDDAQIVRMAFSFTRAALLDKYLEDVSIVLDNALQEARFWLPRRQEIEIRRTGTWLDFPARGIIRGRWEIGDYRVNTALPPEVAAPGPEIVPAPENRRRAFRFEGSILDSLPSEVRMATDDDVARIQTEARAMVRASALARGQTTTLAAGRLSDMVRFTRAEGFALGAGARHRFGHGLAVEVGGRFGFADHQPKGDLALSWESASALTWRLAAFREYRDMRDTPEMSGLANSIAAQEFATDYTDPFEVRGGSLRATYVNSWVSWQATVEAVRSDSVRVAARPVRRTFAPTLPVMPGHTTRASLSISLPRRTTRGGTWDAAAELRTERFQPDSGRASTVGRLFVQLERVRRLGATSLVLRSTGGVVAGARIPLQDLLLAGGPVTAPGYDATRFAGASLVTQRIEWQFPIPAPGFSLGRWGRAPGQATLAPYVHVLGIDRSPTIRHASAGWYPSIGLGLLPAFGLLRFDVARSLRGGGWGVSVDVARDFWRIL